MPSMYQTERSDERDESTRRIAKRTSSVEDGIGTPEEVEQKTRA